jgi:septum formation protein
MTFFNWFGKPIVLASQSPRRQELFKKLEIEFTIHIPDYQEQNDEKTAPGELVLRHAYQKAAAVTPFYQKAWIIGADTIVVKDHHIFGKPKDFSQALEMLLELSGCTHKVYTGYCIINSSNQKYLEDFECTRVTFHPLSDRLINYYINNYKPYDKAGAYAIQDFSAMFVEKIEGCYFNVVGFPISRFFRHILKDLVRIL